MNEKELCLYHSGFEARISNVCHKVEEKEKLVNIKIDAIEKSIEAARREMERRLESMNEFRSQLERQTVTFYSKGEHDEYAKDISSRLVVIEKLLFYKEGAGKWTSHIITVLIALAIFILSHYLFKI